MADKDSTQEQAEFEAWLAPEYSREKWHTGEYKDDTVYSMFAAWRAARAVPAGWKLVPDADNMTDEQAEAICNLVGCCGGGAHEVYEAMLAAAPDLKEGGQ